MRIARIAAALGLMACGIPAYAQQAAGPSAAIPTLRQGDSIVVSRTDAPKLTGVLIATGEDELTLQGDEGPTRVSMTAVTQIWRDDPLWNGALIGAGVGAAAMGVMVSDCKRHDSECRNVATGIGLAVTGGMTAIGVLVDHFQRKLVYERPGLQATLAPVATPRGGGVAVRLRF